MLKERSVQFGADVKLAGVVTEVSRPGDRPACILLNAGVVHRVGPNRLYVRLAREFAALGHLVLRFDFSGRGDSDARTDGLSFFESSVAEARDAMDYLAQSRGARRFILLGICSGGGNAFQSTLADPRVVGAVMVDVHAYPTFGYYLRYYAKRLWNLESWRNTLSGRNALGRTLRRGLGSSESADEPDGEPAEPGTRSNEGLVQSKAETGRAIEAVIDRGVRLLLVFSGTWRAFNYRGQFRDAFPALFRRGMIQVEYFPEADHTFSRLYNQQRLVDTISAWLTTGWPAAPLADAAASCEPFQTRSS
jgi:pimeloyl-ACP methyl ester carboxylesterase